MSARDTVGGCLERQEPEAIWGARRPVLSARRGTQDRRERQEARPEAVLTARRPAGSGGLARRPSWAPGGPPKDRLGRQEAREEAAWGARRPESSVLPTVRTKMQVLRRLQAGCRLQAGVAPTPKSLRRQA